MTIAALVFVLVILGAIADGFAGPAHRSLVASDAIRAALPYLAVVVVSRFFARRRPASASRIQGFGFVVQMAVLTMSHGWWWVEPHASLIAASSGSLATMGWLAAAGALLAVAALAVAVRAAQPGFALEVIGGAWAVLLAGGGHLYRDLDRLDAGARAVSAASIAGIAVTAALALFLLLRRRGRAAGAIPALAPAAALLALYGSGGGPAAPAVTDSVLVVVVDSLRADLADGPASSATPTTGDKPAATPPPKMPQLERIAGDGVRFAQAVSPAPWTLPAMASLLGGWNPHRHQGGASASAWEVTQPLPGSVHLPRTMAGAGYLTAAFVNNPWLRPWFGFADGFYHYRPYHGRAFDGIALALDWMHSHEGVPTFTLLHLMDPHWPYDAPAGFGETRNECVACDDLKHVQYEGALPAEQQEIRRRYRAEVAYTDAMLGRLYDTLVAAGALEHRWLVVTADHGEELWDHGSFLHGHSLNDELLRVPLVVVPPRARVDTKRGVRVEVQVRLEDVPATVFDIAGLDPRLAPDGASLLTVLGGVRPGQAPPRPSVSGFVKNPADLRYAVRVPPLKAVATAGSIRGSAFFDLSKDPGERDSLLFRPGPPSLEAIGIADRYRATLALAAQQGLEVARTAPRPQAGAADAATSEHLRSLGYKP